MFYFNTAFSRIEKGNVFVQSYTVTGSPGAFGAPTTLPPLTPLSADMVLIALGRAPRVQGLDLESWRRVSTGSDFRLWTDMFGRMNNRFL
jgi:pyruvate/2-oxoglutarate dehydrogenase complex dihydrolipoamide dehydrogenase (E3) component